MEPTTDLEVLRSIEVYLVNNSQYGSATHVAKAMEEIERLRAGQFRWIAVSERMPHHHEGNAKAGTVIGGAVLVRAQNGNIFLKNWNAVSETLGHSHWAPIPPLPERTQEEKDEEAYLQYVRQETIVAKTTNQIARDAFLAGLKAARGEK